MDNNWVAPSNLNIDLNSNPIQNPPAESPKLGSEDTCVGERESLLKHEELNRMKSENKKLTDMLTTLLTTNLCDFNQIKQSENDELSTTRKRKADDDYNNNNSMSVQSSKVSRVHVRMDPSDVSLVVKDGYQWRKYGQKVTRDNPSSPRAYYKCSFAPACPVKKKVQRSLDDPSVLVATYEGQHHHPLQSAAGVASSTCHLSSLTDPLMCSTEIHESLVEKMASSLTRNRDFTTALVAAITTRIFDDIVSAGEY